jgi:hypothetical protein
MSKSFSNEEGFSGSSTVEEAFEEEISNQDYGFVLDSNGNLKSVFWPTSQGFETPKNVVAICKAFGLGDPDNVKPQYLH